MTAAGTLQAAEEANWEAVAIGVARSIAPWPDPAAVGVRSAVEEALTMRARPIRREAVATALAATREV